MVILYNEVNHLSIEALMGVKSLKGKAQGVVIKSLAPFLLRCVLGIACALASGCRYLFRNVASYGSNGVKACSRAGSWSIVTTPRGQTPVAGLFQTTPLPYS
jgi:hypothetical protein